MITFQIIGSYADMVSDYLTYESLLFVTLWEIWSPFGPHWGLKTKGDLLVNTGIGIICVLFDIPSDLTTYK